MIELGFEFEAMASPCELRLVGRDEAMLQAAASAAIGEVRRIESKYSRYRADSLLSRLNAEAGTGRRQAVDDETAALLNFASHLHALSGHRFDLTAGVLRRAWDFNSDRPPSFEDVAALLPLIGWHKLGWPSETIGLPLAGMELDFGGIGKEYAADRAAGVLHEAGVWGGYVELGGDIHVFGPRADGAPWRFGIAHPRQSGTLIACVELRQGALATSGDYCRYIEHDGARYCHLLDATTGQSVAFWQSISVLGPTCAAAGGVATVAMLMQKDAGGFLSIQGLPFLSVDHGGKVAGLGEWVLSDRIP